MKTTALNISLPSMLAGIALALGCASEPTQYGRHPSGYPNYRTEYPGHAPDQYPAPAPAPYPENPPVHRSAGWRLIGTTTADYEADHDAIVFRGPDDDFSQIRFKVTGAPLNLQHLIVTYDNGQPDEIRVRQKIGRGGESRVIDLHGGRRSLRRIDFYYDTRGYPRQRAEVTVFGR